jgi:rhomboid protease GluP
MAEYSPLEAVLRLCAAAAPVPWYPRGAAATLGLTEDDLQAFVEQLRGGGLIARTDPAPGYGRGYVLTPAGAQALRDAGALEWLHRGQIPPPRTPAAEGAAEEGAGVPERERAVRMSLLAPFTPYVVYALIAANVAVFLWGVQLQGLKGQALLAIPPPGIAHTTGAVNADDVLTPGWGLVRLLTCCFVHFGLVHLAANMISLYLVGPLLERMWGHARFLVLYLIAGFGGSCAAMVLRPLTPGGQPVTLAGASGALWGVMASMAVWVILNRRYMPRRLLSSWVTQIVIVFVINIALTYQMSGILSAEAHYGGGIVGAVCAVLLHLTRFGGVATRALATAAVAALPVFGLWAVAHPARFNPEWERLEMEQRVLPEVKRRELEAIKVVPGAAADPLIGRNPGRRDEEQVRKAIEAYAEAEATLRPAADLLRRADPYRDPDVEKARQVRLELVEARLDLFALNRRCLEAGKDWSPQDEKKREEAIERVDRLQREWVKLLAR